MNPYLTQKEQIVLVHLTWNMEEVKWKGVELVSWNSINGYWWFDSDTWWLRYWFLNHQVSGGEYKKNLSDNGANFANCDPELRVFWTMESISDLRGTSTNRLSWHLTFQLVPIMGKTNSPHYKVLQLSFKGTNVWWRRFLYSSMK